MADQQDAQLMMQVLQWSSMSGGIDALVNLMSPGFDAEGASATDRDVLTLLLLGETLGTFTKQGLLDKGLVNDLWASGLVWAGVGPAALRQREQFGEPRLWENFEALANGSES
ncbi:DUF4760 domain-containing protein [Nocardioides mesophilus]|uniref:DUF4760 domain-containing protein n=1 Tax=Nocardioides mesophilus TaxID=433659 RepID=UPI001FEC9DFA|nr:DUF4760 domain-containing protein [Nocardioides mesophilus]